MIFPVRKKIGEVSYNVVQVTLLIGGFMKVLITIFAVFFNIHVFAAQIILPVDLQESESLLVKKITVAWNKPVNEIRYTRTCDGIIWNRTLVHVPANVPFDLSFHEFVDYQEEFSRPFPGDEIKGVSIWKEDEQNGIRRLLFKNMGRIFIILKTKTVPAKEFRIAIYGSC